LSLVPQLFRGSALDAWEHRCARGESFVEFVKRLSEMADAAAEEGPPTKRQRLNAELSSAELDNICCSICAEPFVDPVSLRGSGHTYCRACITQALAVQPRCPLSQARIAIRRGNVDAVLDSNHQVRSMIDSQPVTCKYASHGCTARPALEAVDAHEATCPHKPVACSHERCLFVGSRTETEAHEKVCPFVLLGPVLDAQDARIRGLEGEVRDAKRRLTAEHEASERLKARLEALEAARPAVVSPTRRRPSEDDVREAKALYDEGLRHRDNKKWPEAIAAFQKCVALDANHSDAWFQLGSALDKHSGAKCSEAQIEAYQRCIALDPMHAAAHNNLGSVLDVVRKDYDRAEELYRKAIALDPKQTNACWNLSAILERQRSDIPGAIKAVEEYIRRGNPENDGEQDLARLRRKLERST
jgi:Tfp pilus assembly protein PilF